MKNYAIEVFFNSDFDEYVREFYFKDFQEHSNIYYRPDRWFPHVTIAKNNSLEELRNTVSFVMERFVPQIVQVERLVLVEMDYDGGEIYCRNRETKHLKKK